MATRGQVVNQAKGPRTESPWSLISIEELGAARRARGLHAGIHGGRNQPTGQRLSSPKKSRLNMDSSP